MAAVLKLVQGTNEETIETLEWMLQQARRGRLRDFASTFRDDDGVEHMAFTGIYRADSSKALRAAMRMSMHLTRAQDSVYGPP